MHFVLFVFVVVYVLYFVCWGVLLSLRGDFTLRVCYVLVWGIFANGSVFLTYYSGVILVPYIYLHIVVELM